MFTHSLRPMTAALSLALFGLISVQSSLPEAAAQKADETYIASVTGDDVYVRSGPSDSYYPFTKVSTGNLVQVMGEKILDEKSRWARVATTGPAFRSAYGYIRFAKTDSGKMRFSDDGKSGVTLGRVDVIAPNYELNGAAKDSWKPLVRLEADQTVQIMEISQTDKETVLKVALPEGAQGWISLSFLRKATDTEIAQFKSSLTGESVKTNTVKPTEVTHAPTPKPTTPSADSSKNTNTNAKTGYSSADDANSMNSPSDPMTNQASKSETGATTDDQPSGSTTPGPTSKPSTAKMKSTPVAPTLDDLEAALKLLRKEPIDTAEVIPLREMYIDLGKRNPNDARVFRYVTTRVEQLQAWADLQKKQQELAEIRGRLNSTSDEAEAVRKALESSAQYTAVGRVGASTIYDGQGLPKLLRLQDAATGRTIAYLQPDDEYKMVNLIGNLVGIKGEKTYDGSLRLNIIEPQHVDVLTTETTTETRAVSAETPTKP